MEEIKELLIEEVNIYVSDCGKIKYECEHDCVVGVGAFLSPQN